MQADSASTIDDSIRKEKRAQDVDDVDATVRGASPTGVKDIEDAVFGAIGEDGPNYRNVSLIVRPQLRAAYAYTLPIAGMDGCVYRDDQSASRARRALYTGDDAHPRYSSLCTPDALGLRDEYL
jgi:hypothetical protein